MPTKKRVLFFSPFNSPPIFLGLNLEFLQKEINEGNETFFIDCNKTFNTCGFNTYGLKYMCEICVERFQQNSKYISGHYNKLSLRDIIDDSDETYAMEKLNPIEEIQNDLIIDGFDVGESVYSSFISKTKEKNFSTPADRQILKELAFHTLIIHRAIKRFIIKNNIDKLILFNGRWDYYRAALSAARSQNLEIQVIENYRTGGYYQVFGNAFPHDSKIHNELINTHWNSEPDLALKQKLAHEFFLKKRKGVALIDKSFTSDQTQGHIPSYIDTTKKLIVIYNSSDIEFEAVGKEYYNPFFKDQASSILYVAELVSLKKDFQLVIRFHPNLKGLKRDYLEPIYDLKGKYSNVFVIPPEDQTDSYALMDQAYKVVTRVSTMGIEASYWGKPVILLGKSIYTPGDVTYLPQSVEQFPDLLFNDLEPKPKVNAEKYGYYYMTGGIKAEYFNSDSNGYYFKQNNLGKFSKRFKLYYKILKLFKIKN